MFRKEQRYINQQIIIIHNGSIIYKHRVGGRGYTLRAQRMEAEDVLEDFMNASQKK